MKYTATFNRLPFKTASFWQVNDETGKEVLKATVAQMWGKQTFAKFDEVSKEEYGQAILARIESNGIEKTADAMGLAPIMEKKPMRHMPTAPKAPAIPTLPNKEVAPAAKPEAPKVKTVKEFANELKKFVSDIDVDEKKNEYVFTTDDGGKVKVEKETKKQEKDEKKVEPPVKEAAAEGDEKKEEPKETAKEEKKEKEIIQDGFEIKIENAGKKEMSKEVVKILQECIKAHKEINKLIAEIEKDEGEKKEPAKEGKDEKKESKDENKDESKDMPKKEAALDKESVANAVSAKVLENGNLEISVTNPEAIQDAKDIYDALESLAANGYDFVNAEEVGALTEAPIIGIVSRDDQGKLLEIEGLWWYPQYETTDELVELKEKGKLIFTDANTEEPSEEIPSEEIGEKHANQLNTMDFQKKKVNEKDYYSKMYGDKGFASKLVKNYTGKGDRPYPKIAAKQKQEYPYPINPKATKPEKSKEYFDAAYGDPQFTAKLTKKYKPGKRAFPAALQNAMEKRAAIEKAAHDFENNQDLQVGDKVKGGVITKVTRVQDVYANEEEFNNYQEMYGSSGLSWEGNEIMTVDIDKGGIEEEEFIYNVEKEPSAEAPVEVPQEEQPIQAKAEVQQKKEALLASEKDKQIKYLEKKLAEEKGKVEKLANAKDELLDEKSLRIKAEKSIELYKFSLAKGLTEDKEKDEFIEQTMLMDDMSFELFASSIRKMAQKVVTASDTSKDVKNMNGSKVIVKNAGIKRIPNLASEKTELGSFNGGDAKDQLASMWTTANKQTR
jgi:hypothetical protein